MSKIKQIVEGWKNNLFPSEEEAAVIKAVGDERMSICNSCRYHSGNAKVRTLRPDAFCTKCGCTLSAKTKCLSCECPLGYWKALLTEKEEESYENKGDEDSGGSNVGSSS